MRIRIHCRGCGKLVKPVKRGKLLCCPICDGVLGHSLKKKRKRRSR